MEIRLDGKKALVTGAGKGIGRAICKTLIQLGVETYAVSRTQSDLDSLQEEVPGIKTILLDISDWNKTNEILSEVEAVDFVVNNAGVLRFSAFLDVSKDDLDMIMDINFKAVFNISQIFAKKMIGTGKAGSIVNISSEASKGARKDVSIYCCSKTALDMLTKCMALELGEHQIRVNTVNPTLIWTPMTLKYKQAIEDMGLISKIPLGRIAEMEDVVNAVIFLLSDRSSMITGETILVDGGGCAH